MMRCGEVRASEFEKLFSVSDVRASARECETRARCGLRARIIILAQHIATLITIRLPFPFIDRRIFYQPTGRQIMMYIHARCVICREIIVYAVNNFLVTFR